jgi:ankyrin repeat protein
MKLILNKNADLNAKNRCGKTPFYLVIENVELFLKNGANPNIKDLSQRNSIWFAMKSKIDACKKIEILCQYGADINSPNFRGTIPLEYMVSCNEDIILSLISNGANINFINEKNKSFLDLCVFTSKIRVIKELILRKFNTCCQVEKNEKHIPFIYYCYLLSKELFDFAIENGVSLNSCDISTRNTISHYLSFANNIHDIKKIVHFGADLNLENEKKETPLSIACSKNNINLACYLLYTNKIDKQKLSRLKFSGNNSAEQVVLDYIEKGTIWNYNRHNLFPKEFRESVITFLFCHSRFKNGLHYSKQTRIQNLF